MTGSEDWEMVAIVGYQLFEMTSVTPFFVFPLTGSVYQTTVTRHLVWWIPALKHSNFPFVSRNTTISTVLEEMGKCNNTVELNIQTTTPLVFTPMCEVLP